MTQHTPGPWTERGMLVHDQNDEFVAEVLYTGPNGVSEANARLIAAAPDLLAAANRALQYIYVCAMHEQNAGRKVTSDIAKRDLAFVQAAISKAEGTDNG